MILNRHDPVNILFILFYYESQVNSPSQLEEDKISFFVLIIPLIPLHLFEKVYMFVNQVHSVLFCDQTKVLCETCFKHTLQNLDLTPVMGAIYVFCYLFHAVAAPCLFIGHPFQLKFNLCVSLLVSLLRVLDSSLK